MTGAVSIYLSLTARFTRKPMVAFRGGSICRNGANMVATVVVGRTVGSTPLTDAADLDDYLPLLGPGWSILPYSAIRPPRSRTESPGTTGSYEE